MRKITKWTDIGLSDPRDVLWIMRGLDFESVSVGAKGGEWTHHAIWGINIGGNWRGRYEIATGFCSIIPPHGEESRKRAPAALLDILKLRFSIKRFYFFSRIVQSFAPPHRGGTT
jgi:hypothetical protein